MIASVEDNPMNKEIKFRAWLPKGNFYNQDPIMINVDLCEQHSDTTEYFIAQKYGILMQYTQLKDRNGIEIYEGDIYLRWNNNHTAQIPCVVMWENPDIEGGHCGDIHGYVFSVLPHKLEVIGNIYQNPELIK